MKRYLRYFTGLLVIACLTWPFAAYANTNAEPNSIWSTVKGKASEERQSVLSKAEVNMDSWQKGSILSRDPFVVVTEFLPEETEVRSKVQIWTGSLYRYDDNLVTSWDYVWFDPDGKADSVVTDMENIIQDYFKADTQEQFRSLEYVGGYPWVSIPTDKEAAAAHAEQLSDSGIINLYHSPHEGEPTILDVPSIIALPVIPDRVRPERIFKEQVLSRIPKDIEKHWAKKDIVDLMSKGIITGYTDGTIRPNRTLTRSEFITLLMKGLQIPVVGSSESTYTDVGKNWANKTIAEAEKAGVIPKAESETKFRPDETITRLEMTGWISNALNILDWQDQGADVQFKDLAPLNTIQQAEIQKVVNHGIMKGFTDGSFRPSSKLTRAEAFVVISRLIRL